MTDTRTPVPQLPDPTVVAEALTTLMQNAGAAMRTTLAQAATPKALPYDPTTLTRAMIDFNTSVLMQPTVLFEAQAKNWNDWTALWRTMGERAMGQEAAPVAAPAKGDRRFSDPAWSDEPVYDYLKQAYLLAARQLQDFVAAAPVDDATRAQVDFASRQMMNALAPTNFPHTNPQVARRTIESGGLNLMTGLSNLLEDVGKGQGLVGRRAPNDFELGVNVAATPGAVVFRNHLMELIQYAPTTDKVYRRPLLFVPPLVNKYYLFDLTPKASYLKWLVDQGHTVFVISWANPDESHADNGMDAYVKDGVIAALDAVELATGEADADLVSYCLGGTLSAMTLAYLAQTGGADRIASATLIATLVDFGDMGEWSVFTSEQDLNAFDRYLDDRGYVEARDLTKLFSAVRANDLIWSSVVNHYLLGDEARASDLLWWFDDGSRIPARMLKEYGRQILRGNQLKDGGVAIDGVTLDLKAIETPVMIVALKDDHVSAWKNTYAGRAFFGGPTRFLLGGSGHNAGMINPPAANKHGYWTNDAAPADPEIWLADAEQKPGSWWPEWQGWLDAAAADNKVKARKVGAGKLKAGVAAPGDYVRVRH
ncbi:MAG: class I poly(R)-hydroxyalkanoic acid synthase [Alphaproteobacteria bacterium]|jgi:polyhydroxyalkanoate synthase subunit PhaC|nr:class I poly(R)-hydroxyalkanoic acid synthase [Alphaproteobacteria bacterium]MBU2040979.1 class I poly(R)-hydroxyalkanoic acid synthase [Alphaproteobacteria bacterium]MBU2207556.1 class I poly(R)-hydroxyalkanoic acid synthase [Alphaproteobacteria bacterium]MBU2291503.1 class I poly(R)-hydroxyalkanoic acid synthase [Alphaproteobacteria bacterium]MBU2397970.1 class I poly(R)-hydroxyalkanoic acid synthase [Alphaproteobacteria bacterium]